MSSVRPAQEESPLTLIEEAAAGWMFQASEPVNNRALSLWVADRWRVARGDIADNPPQRAPLLLAEARRRLAVPREHGEPGPSAWTESEAKWLTDLSRFVPGSGDSSAVLDAVRTHLSGLEHNFKIHDEAALNRVVDRYCLQAARLVAGMAHAVLAAEELHRSGWSPSRDPSAAHRHNPLPRAFVSPAANCFQLYHQAWPLVASPLNLVQGSAFVLQSHDSRAVAAVKELFRNRDHRGITGDHVTTADVLTLHRLLAWLLGEAPDVEAAPRENSDGTFRVDLSLLAACKDGVGAIDRGTVLSVPGPWEGVFLDPVSLGLQLFDRRFLAALTIGWRCCRGDLQTHRPKDGLPRALAVSVEPSGSGALLIQGGSAGALFACGLLGAAKQQPINIRDSATMALRLTRPPAPQDIPPAEQLDLADDDERPHESPGSPDDPLGAGDVYLDYVAAETLPDKLSFASRGDPKLPQDHASQELLRTVLVVEGQPFGRNESWPAWRTRPGRNFGSLNIEGVRTLAEAYELLRGDALIEEVVGACAQKAINDWDDLRHGRAARVGTEDHKLDIHIEPHIKILVGRGTAQDTSERPEPRTGDDKAPPDPYRRLKGGLDELIRKHLLDDDRWIVLTEDAGAGKTVFTWRLRERLSRWGRQPFLVVRVEGQWPADVRKLLEETVASHCHSVTAENVVDTLLEERRVVILLDALDQTVPIEITCFEKFLDDASPAALARRLRFVVTGRAYAVNERKQDLFKSSQWLPACLELFNEKQQTAYYAQWKVKHPRRSDLWDQLVPDQKSVADLLRFPVVLRMIREILEDVEEDGTDLVPFRNRGDLYWTVAERLIRRAFRNQRRKVDPERLAILIPERLAFGKGRDVGGTCQSNETRESHDASRNTRHPCCGPGRPGCRSR